MKKLKPLAMLLMSSLFLLNCAGNTPVTNKFSMTFVGECCSANNATTYDENSEASFTITADEYFVLPDEIEVSGVEQYSYVLDASKTVASFVCTMINDVTVKAIGESGPGPTPDTYAMIFNGTKCYANNQKQYDKNTGASFTIVPNTGCVLPAKDKIKVNGVKEFDYIISDDGLATFTCTMTSNVIVTVVASGTEALKEMLNFTCLSDKATISLMPYDKFSNLDAFGVLPNLEYSYSGTGDWITVPSMIVEKEDIPQIELTKNQVIYFRGDNELLLSFSFSSKIDFAEDYPIRDGDLQVKGNIMSIVSKENYSEMTEIPPVSSFFAHLFEYNENLVDASKLLLPNKLADSCYKGLFDSCEYLVKAPSLNAIELSKECYFNMFRNCYSLEGPIYLPATKLVDSCYFEMFKGCKKLNHIKVGFGKRDDHTWPTVNMCTDHWLLSTANEGIFEWAGDVSGFEWERDGSHVPEGWEIKTIE